MLFSGVAMLNDIVYVVGGWSGQSGLADCEMFDPKHPKKGWQAIAPLNTGRYRHQIFIKSLI